MFKKESTLTSDTIRLVTMLLVILGAVGTMTGVIIKFQTPPSPIWLPVLAGGSVLAIVGIALMALILAGFLAE